MRIYSYLVVGRTEMLGWVLLLLFAPLIGLALGKLMFAIYLAWVWISRRIMKWE